MSSLDLSLRYCRDEDQWSIVGHSPEITQLFLDAPDLPAHVLRSFWSSNHNTYRLGQCALDNRPIPWSMVKSHQGMSKQGRIPIMVHLAVFYSAATTRNTIRTTHLSHPCSL